MESDEFQLIGSHNNVSQLMVVSLNQAASLPDNVARDESNVRCSHHTDSIIWWEQREEGNHWTQMSYQ